MTHDSEPCAEFMWEKFKPMCESRDAVTVNRVIVRDSKDLHSTPDAADLKGDSSHDTPLDSDAHSQYIK